MTTFAPGLLEINGKKCLIIADSLSHELPASGTVLLERVEGFNIFCLAEELVAKKAMYRSVPVYGYWQTLYASKHWRPETGITAYKHGNIGQYVAIDLDEKTATTGEVVDGCAVATAGEQLQQAQIRWLEIATEDITLPSRPAMTMAEQIAAQEKNNRTILAAVSLAILALIFGLVSGSWYADKEARHLEAHHEALTVQIEEAQTMVSELKKTKLAVAPDQHELLNLLEALSWVEGIEIPNSEIDAIQLSIPYQSYNDAIHILTRHNIRYSEHWLPAGRVQLSLQR